jgi:hypothetical protein
LGGGEEVEVGFADDVFEWPIDEGAEALVGEGESSLDILAEDALGQLIDERFVGEFSVGGRRVG